MYVIKGMVQVLGITYRVVQVRAAGYTVVRILDDSEIGGFSCDRTLETTQIAVSRALMRQVASAAVHQGRTAWLGTGGIDFRRVGNASVLN